MSVDVYVIVCVGVDVYGCVGEVDGVLCVSDFIECLVVCC